MVTSVKPRPGQIERERKRGTRHRNRNPRIFREILGFSPAAVPIIMLDPIPRPLSKSSQMVGRVFITLALVLLQHQQFSWILQPHFKTWSCLQKVDGKPHRNHLVRR